MTWISAVVIPFPIAPGNIHAIAQKWLMVALFCFLWVDVLQNLFGGATSWNWYEELVLWFCLMLTVRFYLYFRYIWLKFKRELMESLHS
jgi:hypothetical protein